MHAARLHDGHNVIVKVRRPGIKRQVEQDMRILAFLVRAVLTMAPRLRRFDPLGLVEEVLHNLRKELDFRQEARNIRRFTEIFRDSATIFVPTAIEGMQTEWVAVQQGTFSSCGTVAFAFTISAWSGSWITAPAATLQHSCRPSFCRTQNGCSVRTLDPDFNLLDGLLAKAPEFAGQAMSEGGDNKGMQRLKYEAAVAFRQKNNPMGRQVGVVTYLPDHDANHQVKRHG